MNIEFEVSAYEQELEELRTKMSSHEGLRQDAEGRILVLQAHSAGATGAGRGV